MTYLRSNAIEWISKTIHQTGLVDSDTDTIADNIKTWAQIGARYDLLCRDLGNYNGAENYRYLGNLFRLPDDMTDRLCVWELYR